MIRDFPHNIRIRLAGLKKMLRPAETANRAETEQRQDATLFINRTNLNFRL